MRTKDILITVLCILISLGLLVSASMLIEPIHNDRQDIGMIENAPLENAPPGLTFATVAMGAFRGLVVDWLWIRADKLKEEGQFFDAKQLAEWITALQPRFASVWDFQAWNMAYNISVTFPESQCGERWRWVKNGYELLRDKGIPTNPNRILLYRSLAWIYQHKIGGLTDNCRKYYIREMALSTRWVLGPNPTPEFFQALLETPEDISYIMDDPKAVSILDRLVQYESSFESRTDVLDSWLNLVYLTQNFSEDTQVLMQGNEEENTTLRKIDLFVRARQIREEWNLDIETMIEVNDRYGPFRFDDPNSRMPMDWENPHTHAIYWAHLGLQRAGHDGDFTANEKNTDRIIAHSLQSLFRFGRIVFYPQENNQGVSVFMLPDMRYFDVLDLEWKKRIEKYETSDKRGATGMKDGHRNLLRISVVNFYQAGQVEKAKEIYRQLRENYPRPEFNQPMMSFIQSSIREQLSSIDVHTATQWIITGLKQSMFRYALYEDEESFARERFAREIYDMYVKEYHFDDDNSRLALPQFNWLRYRAFVQFLDDATYPQNMRANLLARMEKERPDIYEKLNEIFKTEQKELEQMREHQQEQENAIPGSSGL